MITTLKYNKNKNKNKNKKKITKKNIQKGGAEPLPTDKHEIEEHFIEKYKFFNNAVSRDFNEDFYTSLQSNKLNELYTNYETFKKLKLISCAYHGSINLQENDNFHNSPTNIIPDNTIVCFFTLLGNVGLDLNVDGFYNFIYKINRDDSLNILHQLQNIGDITNTYNKVKYKILTFNCFKNATFYYPGQKYINITLNNTSRGKKIYRYTKYFSDVNFNGISSKITEELPRIKLNEYLDLNKDDDEGMINIYFFESCRGFINDPAGSKTELISDMFKYESYLRYYNSRLVYEIIKTKPVIDSEKLKDINCGSKGTNKINFYHEKEQKFIHNYNFQNDYSHHQYSDIMIKIYNNFISLNINEKELEFLLYLSINKQIFILNKIIEFGNKELTSIIFNFIFLKLLTYNIGENNNFEFMTMIKTFNIFNKKYNKSGILAFDKINHLYYIYKEQVAQYLTIFKRYLTDPKAIEELDKYIFKNYIIVKDNNFLVFNNLSYLSYQNYNILLNTNKIIITDKTTLFEYEYIIAKLPKSNINTIIFHKVNFDIFKDQIQNIINILIKTTHVYFDSITGSELNITINENSSINNIIFMNIYMLGKLNLDLKKNLNLNFIKNQIFIGIINGYKKNISIDILDNTHISDLQFLNLNESKILFSNSTYTGLTFNNSQIKKLEYINNTEIEIKLINITLIKDSTLELLKLTNILEVGDIKCKILNINDYTIDYFDGLKIIFDELIITGNKPSYLKIKRKVINLENNFKPFINNNDIKINNKFLLSEKPNFKKYNSKEDEYSDSDDDLYD